MSIPIKHHHLPVFYLKRWTGKDGQLCQYSRPNGDVVAHRKYPKRTAFVERLYELPGLPPEQAQKIEQGFMSQLDSEAAQALVALETGDPRMLTDRRLRSAWSRFIMSLLMRTPEDISALKGGVVEEWTKAIPHLEEQYLSHRTNDDPPTFAEYFATRDPTELERWAVSIAPSLMDHSGLGGLLNNMRWLVRRITSGDAEFLTSDRPVAMSWTLTERHAFLFLPIGPKTLFVAVNDSETQEIVESRDSGEQVMATNRFVSGRAVRFVYARSDAHMEFVKTHMGTMPRKSLLEQLAERRRASP